MAQSQWLNDESRLQEIVYAELEAPLRELSRQIQRLDGGNALLHFLLAQAGTLRTVDDIAYHQCQPAHAVQKSLRGLIRLGLVHHVDAAGVSLYGITRDPERRRWASDLCAWQDRWQARLAQLERAIGGAASIRPQDNSLPNLEFRHALR